jgi:hypothetical protein
VLLPRNTRYSNKAKDILENQYEEFKIDVDEFKQEQKDSIEKMLLYEMKMLEYQKDNEKLMKELESRNKQDDENKEDTEAKTKGIYTIMMLFCLNNMLNLYYRF